MEFGRLPNVDAVDFTLPRPEPGSTGPWKQWLASGSPSGSPSGSASGCDVRLGMASWADPGLAKRLGASVTPGGSVKRGLQSYGLAMPTIELNTTFYGYSEGRFESWRDQVPKGFSFLPKLPRTITHEQGLAASESEMGRFVEATEALGTKRGDLWLALPPYVGPSEFRALEDFLARWRPIVPLAVEVREPRWFRGAVLEDLARLLLDHDVPFIITDTAGRRDVLHMRVTAPRTMVRFVANGLHPTDFTRLDEWARVLALWAQEGLREAQFFFHQRDEAQTVDLADHMEGCLAGLGLTSIAPWRESTGFGATGTQLDLFGG